MTATNEATLATLDGLRKRLEQVEAERDALAAHQSDLVRELTSCQSILHSMAHYGSVTPEYADDAKAVLKRTKDASLARRDARIKAEALKSCLPLSDPSCDSFIRRKAIEYRQKAEGCCNESA
ncbi:MULTISPECIES: hypothetical protein [Halomonas]|uniref:hypothetical protein n=1 Tax=Halomonas TaxID=2745 RepID=UPI001C9851EA|nr:MULTISPECIES: hypothetical protein [Halomonas]MBY6208718.1 hypothetical protein [Halomonas sp. DP3Y7-2]MBY6227189.1 hypothetical protein [Halomonas sp. DP3Y7-1]MCA0915062.1 hypothetical protein [Halomonas denitrificans]